MVRLNSPECKIHVAESGNVKALDGEENLLGVVISKLEPHRGGPLRGYIAMLAVREEHRGKGIATNLVRMAIDVMIEREADEVCFIVFDENLLHDADLP